MNISDTKIKEKVYEKTIMYSGLCFDTTEEVHKAQEFLCTLIKKGIIVFADEKE